MLIGEINGAPASRHLAARLFIEEGFAATAMGLQARLSGTALAGARRGGSLMAESPRDETAEPQPRGSENSTERESIRSSTDRDQNVEREDIESEPDRTGNEDVTGRGEDVDPDSAEADIDRDDTVDE
jgi:hypothetical protein